NRCCRPLPWRRRSPRRFFSSLRVGGKTRVAVQVRSRSAPAISQDTWSLLVGHLFRRAMQHTGCFGSQYLELSLLRPIHSLGRKEQVASSYGQSSARL